MSEMGFENVFYLENFECAGDEVLVESSPPASPDMAARLAAPAQSTGAGGASPSSGAVRDLIVIPELPNSIQLQHAIQQVSSTVVEVNGDSSGHSSPTTEAQHTYIAVAMQGAWAGDQVLDTVKIEAAESDTESEGSNGVNYHVQYVTEPQEIYTQGQQMESLRSFPVYGVSTVDAAASDGASAENGWGGASSAEYTTYGVVVAGDEAESTPSPATPQPPRMPPATVQWLLDNYETAEGVSLPRSTLYAHYLRHCSAHRLEPVNAASFGKLIRSVFLGLRTRRLGTRGNSKYHYYGIRAKPHADTSPSLHAQGSPEDKTDALDSQEERAGAAGAGCEAGAAGGAHRQYLGAVAAPDPPPLLLPPADHTPAHLQALHDHHRAHGVEFLEAVSVLDTGGVERARRSWWRRALGGAGRRLCARRAVAAWLRAADLQLYQRAVDLLLPDVLRPIPPQLTQAIRNFAKSLEGALASGSGGAPAAAARAQASAAAALAGALRRYTSLNHLAQAARAVLTNHHQIHQMLTDLNRVDFRVVQDQASWACSSGSAATAHRLEADFKVSFKATLGRGASLEQWAAWLANCVRGALSPHERRPDYTARARRLLLDWSFYSSLVIRELTLRSAASFGSFHLLRLLYDEYVSYLIERRVAAHTHTPPIAVMHCKEDDEEAPESPAEVEDDDEHENEHEHEHEQEQEQEQDHEQEQEWEWDDEEEEDDDPVEAKKSKLGE